MNTILDCIGRTPLVELRHVVPGGSARIVAKLESANPSGYKAHFVVADQGDDGQGPGAEPPSGALVALRVAERLGADETVGTIIIDSGLRYLSTEVFRI